MQKVCLDVMRTVGNNKSADKAKNDYNWYGKFICKYRLYAAYWTNPIILY